MARKLEKVAQFTIRIPQDLKDALQEAAKEQDIDGITWVRHAIREKLERDKETHYGGLGGMRLSELKDVIREVLSQELNTRGAYAGVIHGVSIADSGKFEKVKSFEQRRY